MCCWISPAACSRSSLLKLTFYGSTGGHFLTLFIQWLHSFLFVLFTIFQSLEIFRKRKQLIICNFKGIFIQNENKMYFLSVLLLILLDYWIKQKMKNSYSIILNIYKILKLCRIYLKFKFPLNLQNPFSKRSQSLKIGQLCFASIHSPLSSTKWMKYDIYLRNFKGEIRLALQSRQYRVDLYFKIFVCLLYKGERKI